MGYNDKETSIEKQRSFKTLNLTDDFLFSKVMEDKEILKPVLEKILEMKIKSLEIIQPQKTIDIKEEAKGIRLDIYADDKDNSVYTLEMQKRNEYNIPKRSRYYHSAIDLDLLAKGEKYKTLRKSFVIFICVFDEFGKGRHKYTFENVCIEDNSIKLNDGSQTIILNTKGTLEDVDRELKAFLQYLEKTDDKSVEEADSQMIKLIHKKVAQVKASEELEVEYMTLLERDEMNFEDGKRVGLEAGIETGKREGIETGIMVFIIDNQEEGVEKSRIISKLIKRFDITEVEAEDYYKKYSELV